MLIWECKSILENYVCIVMFTMTTSSQFIGNDVLLKSNINKSLQINWAYGHCYHVQRWKKIYSSKCTVQNIILRIISIATMYYTIIITYSFCQFISCSWKAAAISTRCVPKVWVCLNNASSFRLLYKTWPIRKIAKVTGNTTSKILTLF